MLLVLNIWLNPVRFAPSNWGTLLGLAAPLIGAALASTPAILGGRGGIDVSVGPLMGFVNAIVVKVLITDLGLTSPFVIVPAAVLIGAAVGAVNGFLAAYVRIQPIVATLGTYLVLVGVTLTILPAPMGTVPAWLKLAVGVAVDRCRSRRSSCSGGAPPPALLRPADGDRPRRPRRLYRRCRRRRSCASCPT